MNHGEWRKKLLRIVCADLPIPGEQVRRRVALIFAGYCGFIVCVHCHYCARHHRQVSHQ